MLEKVPDPGLRVYIVWLPILGPESKKAATGATSLISDVRAAHFWDRDQALGKLYSKVLGLPPDDLAWDVYLLFPEGVRWEREAPKPTYWMHQVFYPSDNYLDAHKFLVEVEKLLLVPVKQRSCQQARPSVTWAEGPFDSFSRNDRIG